MSPEEKKELLDEAIKQLAGHPGFHAFVDALREMKQSAITFAISNDVVESPGRIAAALGEIRAYEDIFNLVDEHIKDSS
jgi:hypothetical protein